MKPLIWTIMLLILILLAANIAISHQPNSYTLKTFVIDGNKENVKTNDHKLNTFVIGHKPSGRSMLIETKRKTMAARKRNLKYHQRDEEIEECIEKITKNWKRAYYKTSYEKVYDDDKEKWITTKTFYEREKEFYGYDEDEDFWFKWRLKNRALEGKKIC